MKIKSYRQSRYSFYQHKVPFWQLMGVLLTESRRHRSPLMTHLGHAEQEQVDPPSASRSPKLVVFSVTVSLMADLRRC